MNYELRIKGNMDTLKKRGKSAHNSSFLIPNSSLVRGQAVMITVVLMLFISLAIVFGLVTPAVKSAQVADNLIKSKRSYALAESGAEDVTYRIMNGKSYASPEILVNGNDTATTTIAMNYSTGQMEVVSAGNVLSSIRKTKVYLKSSNEAAFNFGVQVGNGGIIMENTSSVTGNVYANGAVSGENSNVVRGSIVSAGAGGSVDGAHATSSVYANAIANSQVDGDAYYQSIANTTVVGALHPGSPNQPTQAMPISDAVINALEQSATSTVINSPCPYVISDDATIGPAKINCGLTIKGNTTVTLAGNLWVVGDISIENTADIKMSASLGGQSIAIIADNIANRLTSSTIDLKNSALFKNTGIAGTYVMVVSMNNSSEAGGAVKAIEVENSISGAVLVYAPHGEINLKNSAALKEVTAYKVRLSNTANVIYESGLANLLFSGGPSGSFMINGWKETF
jgi:hypothetical protein